MFAKIDNVVNHKRYAITYIYIYMIIIFIYIYIINMSAGQMLVGTVCISPPQHVSETTAQSCGDPSGYRDVIDG